MSILARILLAIGGFLLVAIGFLMGVQAVAAASLPAHKRPRWAQRAGPRLALVAARFLLMGAGVVLAGVASSAFAAGLLVALPGAWARRRYVRSARHQRRILRSAFVYLCKQDPGVPREELLAFLIQSRHPRWDPEMVSQMVRDHPTVDGLLDSLVALERQVFE